MKVPSTSFSPPDSRAPLPTASLGRTGAEVTILGLGGEGILRTHGFEREAYALINHALDLGITYCESARPSANQVTSYP